MLQFDEIKKAREEIELKSNLMFEGKMDIDDIVKGKELPIGTVSRGYKKVAKGKWISVKKDTSRANATTKGKEILSSGSKNHSIGDIVYSEKYGKGKVTHADGKEVVVDIIEGKIKGIGKGDVVGGNHSDWSKKVSIEDKTKARLEKISEYEKKIRESGFTDKNEIYAKFGGKDPHVIAAYHRIANDKALKDNPNFDYNKYSKEKGGFLNKAIDDALNFDDNEDPITKSFSTLNVNIIPSNKPTNSEGGNLVKSFEVLGVSEDLIKAQKTGFYQDNSKNRKAGVVGQKYSKDKKEDPEKKRSSKDDGGDKNTSGGGDGIVDGHETAHLTHMKTLIESGDMTAAYEIYNNLSPEAQKVIPQDVVNKMVKNHHETGDGSPNYDDLGEGGGKKKSLNEKKDSLDEIKSRNKQRLDEVLNTKIYSVMASSSSSDEEVWTGTDYNEAESELEDVTHDDFSDEEDSSNMTYISEKGLDKSDVESLINEKVDKLGDDIDDKKYLSILDEVLDEVVGDGNYHEDDSEILSQRDMGNVNAKTDKLIESIKDKLGLKGKYSDKSLGENSYQVRVSDHNQNPRNNKKEYNISIVIADKNATKGRFRSSGVRNQEIYFNSNSSIEDIEKEYNEAVKNIKKDIKSKKDVKKSFEILGINVD